MNLADRLDAEHLAVYARLADVDLSDIPARRAAYREMRARMDLPPIPDGVIVEDHHVPATDGDPAVRVRLYRPDRQGRDTAALYWMHGGGYVMGEVAMDDVRLATDAADLGIVIASVDYRLAPEHPHPIPLEDCHRGLVWLAAEADRFGIDRDRIAIGGSSAGGGLAAGLALLTRDRGTVAPVFQLLASPMLDDRNPGGPDCPAYADPKVWNHHTNAIGWDAYLAGRAGDPDVSPYAAPARATDLGGLPPALICVGDLDLFLGENLDHARALAAAGVPVELHVYPGAYHGSTNVSAPHTALSKRWRQDERDALARALGC